MVKLLVRGITTTNGNGDDNRTIVQVCDATMSNRIHKAGNTIVLIFLVSVQTLFLISFIELIYPLHTLVQLQTVILLPYIAKSRPVEKSKMQN